MKLIRLLLALVAVGVLVAPFDAAWQLYEYQRHVSRQMSTAPTALAATATAQLASEGRELSAQAPPVVLTYHDIRPGVTNDPYIVSPQALDQQLSALQAAGYQSLTADQYAAYLRGGPVPPRSVVITFDDGTHGLWVYADRILARHGMHAISFLITGRVSKHRPYYLSWEEVARMARSGRWDFECHTHDLHTQIPTGYGDGTASALVTTIYDKTTGRRESVSDYRARVTADIDQSFTDFAVHGLPKPLMFAYPFSEPGNTGNPAIGSQLDFIRRLIHKDFLVAFTDIATAGHALPSSRRAADQQEVVRFEVLAWMTPDYVVQQVMARTAILPSVPDALSRTDSWKDSAGKPMTSLGVLTGSTPFPSGGGTVYADFAPFATADWNDYTVTAYVRGLAPGNTGHIYVRTDSMAIIDVRVSATRMDVLGGTGTTVLGTQTIPPGTGHHIAVTVEDDKTTAVIDGQRIVVPNTAGPESLGGFALASFADAGAAGPTWAKVSVTPTNKSALSVPGDVPLPVSAANPGAGAQFWTDESKGAAALTAVEGGGLKPVGAKKKWMYAAYDPEQTKAWTDYTETTTVSGLAPKGVSASVMARVGAADQVTVRVSSGNFQVVIGTGKTARVLADVPLRSASHHVVSITVTADHTRVTVDGKTYSVTASGSTGGIAIAVYRTSTALAWPVFTPSVAPVR